MINGLIVSRLSKHATLSLLLICVFLPPLATAVPSGPQVVTGQATISAPDANTLNITNSDGAIINWQGFSIGAGETTRFLQPSSTSAVLNRVIGQNPSAILGSLLSNGSVFLINPNGILFGPSAVVDVHSLVASTLDLSDQNFLNKSFDFNQVGNGAGITFQSGASLTTDNGGRLWVIAKTIEAQQGVNFTTPNSGVLLAAASRLQFTGTDLANISFTVDDTDNTIDQDSEITAGNGFIGRIAGTIRQNGINQLDTGQTGFQPGLSPNTGDSLTLEPDNILTIEVGTPTGGSGNSININAEGTLASPTDSSLFIKNAGAITLTAQAEKQIQPAISVIDSVRSPQRISLPGLIIQTQGLNPGSTPRPIIRNALSEDLALMEGLSQKAVAEYFRQEAMKQMQGDAAHAEWRQYIAGLDAAARNAYLESLAALRASHS